MRTQTRNNVVARCCKPKQLWALDWDNVCYRQLDGLTKFFQTNGTRRNVHRFVAKLVLFRLWIISQSAPTIWFPRLEKKAQVNTGQHRNVTKKRVVWRTFCSGNIAINTYGRSVGLGRDSKIVTTNSIVVTDSVTCSGSWLASLSCSSTSSPPIFCQKQLGIETHTKQTNTQRTKTTLKFKNVAECDVGAVSDKGIHLQVS